LADPAELDDAIDRYYETTSEIHNHPGNYTQEATSGGALPAQAEEALVMKYKKVDVSEQTLEDLIRRHADQIEDGLTYVDHQKHTGTGRIDVLLADSGGALIVAELKAAENDGMLFQAIGYYDHLVGQIDRYARLYSKHNIDPAQEVRLFLIAPSFSIALVTRCKWVNVPISLFTYTCIRLEGGSDVIPVFNELAIPSQPLAIEVYSVENHLKYVTDPGLKPKFLP
jgi:hypothetical protein